MMIQSKTNNHLSLIIWLGVLYNCRETFTDVMSALQIRLFMQNKANFRKSQMNVNKVLTRDYEKRTLGERGKKQSQTNPNKAKFKKAKMNVTSIITKGYENKPPIRAPKKQSQTSKRQKPMQTYLPQRIMKITAISGPGKTNPNKAKQTQPVVSLSNLFQRQKNAAKSLTRRYSRGSRLPQIRHCKKLLEREQLWLIHF